MASIQNKQTELESEITAVKSNLEGLAEKSRKATFSEMEGRISKMSEYTMGEVQQQIDRSCNLIVRAYKKRLWAQWRTEHDMTWPNFNVCARLLRFTTLRWKSASASVQDGRMGPACLKST